MLIRRKRPCINVEIWVYLDSSDFEANRLEQHTNAAGNDAFPHPADHSAANKDVLHGHTRAVLDGRRHTKSRLGQDESAT